MALRLMSRLPGLRKIKPLVKYETQLIASGFAIDAMVWIILSVLISFGATFAILLFVPKYPVLAIVVLAALIDLLIGFPYFKAMSRIDQIEESFPDVLKQMADTLRAGGTYEYTLREISESEYGPIKKEMQEVLRKLEEGENFENSLKTLSENIDSRLVQRVVTIIIDSVRSGAGLADILEQISEDVREMKRLDRERKSRTMMQVIFMAVAGGAVAPAIFGFVSTVIRFLINSARASSPALQQNAVRAIGMIDLGVQIYIFVVIFAASLMIAIMRDGKMSKSILYFPILLFIAYTCYLAAQLISQNMFKGFL
jgi:flagellar protein FlaJ